MAYNLVQYCTTTRNISLWLGTLLFCVVPLPSSRSLVGFSSQSQEVNFATTASSFCGRVLPTPHPWYFFEFRGISLISLVSRHPISNDVTFRADLFWFIRLNWEHDDDEIFDRSCDGGSSSQYPIAMHVVVRLYRNSRLTYVIVRTTTVHRSGTLRLPLTQIFCWQKDFDRRVEQSVREL